MTGRVATVNARLRLESVSESAQRAEVYDITMAHPAFQRSHAMLGTVSMNLEDLFALELIHDP